MEALQKLISRISKQLSELSVSQRLALGMGTLLVAISLAWMGQWAASPEMVPLWDQQLSADDLATIRTGLDRMNEPYEIRGDQILVRGAANRSAIVAQLQQMNQMPSDLSMGFEALIKEANPFTSESEKDRHWTVALQRELERILVNFQGVKQAHVVLNLSASRKYTRVQPPKSASVQLIMQGNEPAPESLGKAAARLVAGAVRGLRPDQVNVVDGNGNNVIDWESNLNGGTQMTRLRTEHEQTIQSKIRTQLAFDPKALVSVRVEMDFATRSTHQHTLDDPVEVTEERTAEERTRLRSGGQPGVQPNVGTEIGRSGADEQYTKETNRIEKETGYTKTEAHNPGGEIREIFAAINISHSYLESIFQRGNPDAEPPTFEQIQTIFDEQKAGIVDQVAKLVKASADEDVNDHVAVNWYYDSNAVATTVVLSTQEQAFELAQRFGPQAGLGLLALIALLMMVRMAKKKDDGEAFGLELGLPKEAIEAARAAAAGVSGVVQESQQAAAADGETAEATRTSAAEGVLMAQEVDESTVQMQKMLEEVAEIVSSDPEAVSTLIERWIEKTPVFK